MIKIDEFEERLNQEVEKIFINKKRMSDFRLEIKSFFLT